MKSILTEISRALKDNPDYRSDLINYYEMRKHDGWKLHQEMLLTIRGLMANDLLSSRFTKLGERDKDVQQRVYNSLNEVIGFLLNPLEKAMKKAQFERNFEREMRNQWERPKGERPGR